MLSRLCSPFSSLLFFLLLFIFNFLFFIFYCRRNQNWRGNRWEDTQCKNESFLFSSSLPFLTAAVANKQTNPSTSRRAKMFLENVFIFFFFGGRKRQRQKMMIRERERGRKREIVKMKKKKGRQAEPQDKNKPLSLSSLPRFLLSSSP